MEQIVTCSNCSALIRAEDEVQGQRITDIGFICPQCTTAFEIEWPIQSGALTITVIRRGTSKSEDVLIDE
jgi:hypothetical protein